MKAWIQRVTVFLALVFAAVPVSGQNPEEKRQEPTHIRRECPDIPLRFLNPFNPDWRQTRREQRPVREQTAQQAARCRAQLLVGESQELARNVEQLFYNIDSAGFDQERLAEHSNEIEATIDRLAELVNFGTDPPEIRVTLLANADLELQVRRLVALSARLIPNLLSFVNSDFYDLNLIALIRTDLALTKAITQVLPDSRF